MPPGAGYGRREAFLATPVGAATAAKEAGQPFFEVQLDVGAHSGSAGWGAADGRHTTSSSAVTLGEIEKARLAAGARGVLLLTLGGFGVSPSSPA